MEMAYNKYLQRLSRIHRHRKEFLLPATEVTIAAADVLSDALHDGNLTTDEFLLVEAAYIALRREMSA